MTTLVHKAGSLVTFQKLPDALPSNQTCSLAQLTDTNMLKYKCIPWYGLIDNW